MTKLFTPTLAAALFFAAAAPSLSASVTNITTGNTYTTLDEALAVIADGNTLQIDGTVTAKTNILIETTSFSIQGKDNTATIAFDLASGTNAIYVKGAKTFSLKDVILDCSKITECTGNFINQGDGTLNIENATIKNLKTTTTNGLVRTVGQNTVATNLTNLVFENCTIDSTTPYEILDASKNENYTLTLKGDYSGCRIQLNQAIAFVNDGGITASSPVIISTGSHTSSIPVVKGSTDLSKFRFKNTKNAQMLVPRDGNLYSAAYQPFILVNNGTGTGYASLNDVVKNASADSKNLVYANEDIVYSSAANFGGMTVDFIALNPEANKITIAADKHLANASKANTILSFSGFTITQDLTKVATLTAAFVADVQGEGSSVTFDNVTFDGLNSTKSFIRNLNAGAWHLNNVTFTNCVADNEGVAQSFATANLGGNSVSGTVTGLSLTVNGEYSVDAKGLVAGPIEVSVPKATDTSDFELFTNCTNPDLFTVNNGYELKANANGGLNFAKATGTGIGSIEAADNDSPAEYFTLDGRRVNPENLTSGLYIRRQNGKAVKIAIR